MKKLIAVFCVATLFVTVLFGPAFGADENKNAPGTQQAAARIKPPMPMDKNIVFISGSISKIDATVPESLKLEVFNEVDGKSHIVEIGMGTNVLKVIEAGELKEGDKARVVARKVAEKEIAISVVAGKLKETQMPGPPAQPRAPAPIMKKDQTKK